MLETSRDTKEYIHIAIMLLVWLELADDKREPVLRDGVCDDVRPDVNKGLVKLRCVYARRLCADDGGLFAVVSCGDLQSVNLHGIGKERCSEGHTEYMRDLLSTCIIIKGGTTRIRRKNVQRLLSQL